VKNGYSRRRPDLFLDLGYQFIIVEIDEGRHKCRSYSDEFERMMAISQDIKDRPVIFIRFNPDNYVINKEKFPSCWHKNELGSVVVKQNKIYEWIYRLEALKSRILYWSKTKSIRTLEVDKLFFGDDQ